MSDFLKDPDDTIQFTWDWGEDCTAASTTVSSVTFVVPSGITKSAQSNTTTTATGTFTGGTAGQQYRVTCRATFANGEILDWTKAIIVKNL